MNDPQISAYFAINSPKASIQYGGTVAAPIVKELIAESLTILNVQKQNGGVQREARWWVDKFIYTVDDYVGKNRKSIGFHPYYKFKIVGDGDTIIAQSPEAGEKIVQDGYVTLYTN